MRRALIAWLSFVALACGTAFAHDIPTDVRLRAFVKPEAHELRMLVRVPLAAMREVDVPVRPNGSLDLTRVDTALREAAALWLTDNLQVREDGRDLGRGTIVEARVSLASDRSFESWDAAMALMRAPRIDPATDLFWNQQFLDALIAWPIASPASRFEIHPAVEKLGLRVATTVHFLPREEVDRAFELHGDPGWVALDPGWTQAAALFVAMGFRHILEGTDHLLFIACLVIPFRRLKPLVIIATAFTVAHSITLAAAATGHAPDALWFPPLVELLIAVSIVYLALENILGLDARRRWVVAFAFGLVHGFGFAFGLKESLQFAGGHLATALLSFNLGVELGQVAVLLMLVPLLDFAFKRIPERIGIVVLSAIVGHTAWHWMQERWDVLSRFPLPSIDAATGASLLRWAMALVGIGTVAWLVKSRLGSRLHGNDDAPLRHPHPRVPEHPHPGGVVAPPAGVPGERHGSEDALGVRHQDGETAVGRGD